MEQTTNGLYACISWASFHAVSKYLLSTQLYILLRLCTNIVDILSYKNKYIAHDLHASMLFTSAKALLRSTPPVVSVSMRSHSRHSNGPT